MINLITLLKKQQGQSNGLLNISNRFFGIARKGNLTIGRLGILVVLLLLSEYSNASQVQDSLKNHYFRNLSIVDGLSQSTVFDIAQDTLGYMWMGTQDGLNRYDGKSFTTYRPLNGNSHSLQSKYIRSVFLDSKGLLWIGGNNGISKYNYASDNFVNFYLPNKSGEWYISSIVEDKEGVIWAGSSSGQIFYLKKGATNFKYLNSKEISIKTQKINKLLAKDDRLYIGAGNGLYSIQLNTKMLQKINLNGIKHSINDLLLDGDKLWIGTEGAGLLRYRIQDSTLKQYLHKSIDKKSLADDNVRSLRKDTEGHLWIGTFYGLSILDTSNNNFKNYFHSSTIPYTISQNSVRSIYCDKQGGMWIGTYYGGVNYYHHNDIKFNLLNFNSGPLSLNGEVVNVIKEDQKGNFWIGTNDQGLNYWDRKKNNISYFSHDESVRNTLSSNNIKAIIFDENQKLLIGTHNAGLNYFNPITGENIKYKHSNDNPESIASNMVYALLRDHKNRIWVGTRSGLDLFNPLDGKFSHYYLDKVGNRLTSDVITYLMEDSQQRIWIGTNKGINVFYPENMLFDPLTDVNGKENISNSIITCITEDQKGRIWIGTRNGMKRYDEKTGFKEYNTTDGLPNNVIYGILVDDEGSLWISTNNGLAKFNPDTEQIQLYDHKDGLQSNQFNLYAFCKASDGMMLFGGIQGISYFYPEIIHQESLKLKITITGLDIYNDRINSNNESPTIEKHIDKVKQLEFKPDQKQFTLYFNSFNYSSPNKITYLYKLEGYDNQWQTTGKLPKASYANLPAGSYNFLVKAHSPMGDYSPTRSIEINIVPVWWKSNWFYILLGLFITIGAYISYKIVAERIRTLHQLKLARIERDKSDAVNKMKMEFFTNVSHEFRTPLTLIIAPVEEILNNTAVDDFIKKKHQLIMLNAKRLLFLVDQLIEFRKVELGNLKLNIESDNLVNLTRNIYTNFTPLSNKKNIKFTFSTSETKLMTCYDKDSIQKVCFNLLSNAFKFTKEGGSIELRLSKLENDFAVIQVIDSGIGMAPNEQKQIFDRFYQINKDKSELGSGIGLALTKRLVEHHNGSIEVESIEGKGTSFKVLLPLSEPGGTVENLLTKTGSLVKEETKLLNEREISVAIEELEEEVQRETILIVEDNIEIINYVKEYFAQYYGIITATNGQEALEIIETTYVDIIICDIMMPKLDGLHFCKRVKQNIKTNHIPIILLTAKKQLEQQIEGFEAGADAYITKPFSIRLLHLKVENILQSRKRLKEYYAESKDIIPENIVFNIQDEEFLRKALNIVEENISEPTFSVEEFSKKIGMSRSNLYLKFKAITGESITEFIKRIRFKKAVLLIETQKYTLAQVAYMSGFNSPSYFSTSFKQYFGYIPTQHLDRQKIS